MATVAREPSGGRAWHGAVGTAVAIVAAAVAWWVFWWVEASGALGLSLFDGRSAQGGGWPLLVYTGVPAVCVVVWLVGLVGVVRLHAARGRSMVHWAKPVVFVARFLVFWMVVTLLNRAGAIFGVVEEGFGPWFSFVTLLAVLGVLLLLVGMGCHEAGLFGWASHAPLATGGWLLFVVVFGWLMPEVGLLRSSFWEFREPWVWLPFVSAWLVLAYAVWRHGRRGRLESARDGPAEDAAVD